MMPKTNETELIKTELETLFPEIVSIRRSLHEHPERGTKEHETDRIIIESLNRWGIPWYMCADTGIVAWLEGHGTDESDQKVVALRADIDALPIEEAPEHKCRSKNPGMMHACGHDGHTAVALGTARLLQMHQEEWSGMVKFFFQPAEETVGGAQRMVEEGCMEDPSVDYVTGLHLMPQYHTGQVELKYGKLNASSDEVQIEVYGKGCHGAYPENGVDAIVTASGLVLSLQSLVSRSISPLNSVVLTFGKMQGGTAGNILCDHVTLTGTLRTLDPKTREWAQSYIRTQANSIAAAYGGHAEVLFHSGYNALINTDKLVDLAAETAEELIGRENIFWKEFPSLGVEDFSFFADAAKGGVFYHLGCTAPGQAEIHSLHTAEFELDEACLKVGMMLQYTLARKLLYGKIE